MVVEIASFHKKKKRKFYSILRVSYYKNDDLNGEVVSNADCQSKGPGFESRVSHGPFQKV
jgi:hypothetical protein